MKIANGLLIWFLFVFKSTNGSNRPQNGVKCNPNEKNSCPEGYCCVKEVYVPRDVMKPAEGYILCKPRLRSGEFCLHKPEGYLCPCEEGLQCVSDEKRDNFGHCQTTENGNS